MGCVQCAQAGSGVYVEYTPIGSTEKIKHVVQGRNLADIKRICRLKYSELKSRVFHLKDDKGTNILSEQDFVAKMLTVGTGV